MENLTPFAVYEAKAMERIFFPETHKKQKPKATSLLFLIHGFLFLSQFMIDLMSLFSLWG